jgi:L-ascorbate metabolism protein UlaG (beta-lactamase superfamily)
MKKTTIFLFFLLPFILSGLAQAGCRNPDVVENNLVIQFVSTPQPIGIEWFGHSFFQISSSKGTKIITDPFGPMGFPMPEVWPDVVTVGREHGNHNNVNLAHGNPLILRGLKDYGEDWNEINLKFRDVLIYNVPVHQRGFPEWSLKGSGFVFEMDGLCVFHTGDVSEPFNEDQLQLIGHVDILLIPIGGRFTLGPEGAKKVIEQLKPKITVPMHFWYYTDVLERFTDGPYQARFFDSNTFSISKETLPLTSEIFVLKVQREGEQ